MEKQYVECYECGREIDYCHGCENRSLLCLVEESVPCEICEDCYEAWKEAEWEKIEREENGRCIMIPVHSEEVEDGVYEILKYVKYYVD